MRGHEPILAMRQRGMKPALVFLDLDRNHAPAKSWLEWPGVSPAIPTVWVQEDDAPNRLDLRFLVGLSTVISGTDEARVAALERAAIDAGAHRVVAVVLVPHIDRGERTHRVVRVTDNVVHANNLEDPEHGPAAA